MNKRKKMVNRLNKLTHEGNELLIKNKPNLALKKLKRAIKLAKFMGETKSIAGLYNDMGSTEFKREKYPEAITNLKNALEIKRRLGDANFIHSTLMMLGITYRANCDYNDSLAMFNEALNLAKKGNKTEKISSIQKEIKNTIFAKEKKPVMQFADVRVSSDGCITESVFDNEYLPLLFEKLTVRIEDVSIQLINPNEAKLNILFLFEKLENPPTNIYENDKWKQNRPTELMSTIEGASPNFLVFYGKNTYLREKDCRLTNEENKPIGFNSLEQCWNIFTPNSYPINGFMNPMPKYETFQYFMGTGRLFYWKISFVTKYSLEIVVRKTKEDEPFQFGLFFPFKKVILSANGISITTKNNSKLKKGYMKRINYNETRNRSHEIMDYIDISKPLSIYSFNEDTIHFLDSFKPTQVIEINDFEVLFFELFPTRQILSKYQLFPILKKDLDFRQEVGEERYGKLMKEIIKLPEKCKRNITGKMCRDCSTNPTKICVINLIGIICESEILPHHGFEYADLLIEKTDSNNFIPIIAKGSKKLTWGQDQGLFKQIIEKLTDTKVDVIVVAASGQIDNSLKIQIEYYADLHKKSLIFLTAKELSQFLNLFHKHYPQKTIG